MALIKNKRDQYLIIILIIIIIGIGFLWWKNFQTNNSSAEQSKEPTFQTIKIDFEFLKNVPLENFELFSGVPEFVGEISSRNPFLPK